MSGGTCRSLDVEARCSYAERSSTSPTRPAEAALIQSNLDSSLSLPNKMAESDVPLVVDNGTGVCPFFPYNLKDSY